VLELEVKQEWVKEARALAKELGVLNNSIKNGEGNIYGFLGEILICKITSAKINRTFDYDIVYNNLKIDVKTKCCTSKPLNNYYCSVAAFNVKQRCDYYTFVRILKDFSKAWILGSIKKVDFFKFASFNKRDEIDKNSSFGWKFKADCFNLEIQKLNKLYRIIP
jgi:hypothetical protein